MATQIDGYFGPMAATSAVDFDGDEDSDSDNQYGDGDGMLMMQSFYHQAHG